MPISKSHFLRSFQIIKPGKPKNSANTTATDKHDSSDEEAMIVTHALSTTSKGNWIIDSGATCHMCSDKKLFRELRVEKHIEGTNEGKIRGGFLGGRAHDGKREGHENPIRLTEEVSDMVTSIRRERGARFEGDACPKATPSFACS